MVVEAEASSAAAGAAASLSVRCCKKWLHALSVPSVCLSVAPCPLAEMEVLMIMTNGAA